MWYMITRSRKKFSVILSTLLSQFWIASYIVVISVILPLKKVKQETKTIERKA